MPVNTGSKEHPACPRRFGPRPFRLALRRAFGRRAAGCGRRQAEKLIFAGRETFARDRLLWLSPAGGQ
jgi:hypothetical protein